MKNIKKPTLVPDWRAGWKWFSVQANAVNASFLATWALLPEKFQNAVPISAVLGIAIAILVIGTLGRFIDQTPKE